MSLLLAAKRPALFGSGNIFTENVQAMAAVAGAELANKYAAKCANQLNYGNPAWDYKGEGAGPRFFGYEGIGFGGSAVTSRTQILWEFFDIPVFQVPPAATLPNQKVWFALNEEEVLRSFHENANLQGQTLAVPVPDPKLMTAGIVKFTGTLTSVGEMTGIAGWPANRSLKVNGNASLVKGPGLPAAGVFFGVCGATTATLITPALETHANAEYEAFSLEGSGTDRHAAIWRPSTDEYWEFWNLGMWSGVGITQFRCSGVNGVELGVLKGLAAEPQPGTTLPKIESNDKTKTIIEAGTVISAWNPETGTATLTPPANFALVFGAGGTQVANKNVMLASGSLGVATAGQWRYGNANYFPNVSQSNGVGQGGASGWGARATNLAAVPGNISMQDLVQVERGGEIRHAIGINLIVTKAPALLPATRGDESKLAEAGGNTGEQWQVNIPAFTAKLTVGKTASAVTSFLYIAIGMVLKEVAGVIEAGTKITAFDSVAKTIEVDKAFKKAEAAQAINMLLPNIGTADQVPQGAWFRFPDVRAEGLTAYAEAHGLTGIVNVSQAANPLAWAIYEAIRRYGMVPLDRTSAVVKGMIYDPKVIGSPYNPGGFNGLAGYQSVAPEGAPSKAAMTAYAGAGVTGQAPLAGVIPLKGELEGTNCAFNKLPWALLEQVVPRAS